MVSQGRYPYFPVLEEMVSKERLNSGVSLGILNVPSDFFVGTKTEGRTNAFAANIKLQKIVGKSPEETWKEEELSSFRANYYYFKQLYESMGGKAIDCTVGDAFLTYLDIYGYDSFKAKSTIEIKKEIENMQKMYILENHVV